MNRTQKHIINKLRVDVLTNDSRSAFDLKDNIDGFLKDDILPFLESYFSIIEGDLHSQSIQIPYLSVNVNTSSILNYKELKEDVKRALTKELKRVTNLAHPNNEEAKLTAIENGKENTLLHFLETGTSPWWMRSEEIFELSQEEFQKFLQSKNFLIKFQSKLINVAFRKRVIQQLSDQQIKSVLKSIDSERFSKIWREKFHLSFPRLHSTDRKDLWDGIIDDILQKDNNLFASRLIFLLTEKLLEKGIEKKNFDKGSQTFMEVVVSILSKLENTSQAKQTLEILKANTSLSKELFIQIEDHSELSLNKIQERVTLPKLDKSEDINGNDQVFKPFQDTLESIQDPEEKVTEPIISPEDAMDNVSGSNEKSKETESTIERKTIQDQNDVRTSDQDEVRPKENEKVEMQKNISDETIKPDKKSGTNASEELSLIEVQESLNELIKKEDRALFKELKSMSEQKANQIEGELHINNAGLILLHPYLKDFFKHCGLLNNENKLKNKELAVHTLHYLATKQEQQFENNMLFEKVLCGVPIEEPIQRTIPLSKEFKANAEELLEAVLANWGVLKNASPDLLRGEFLQRFGKISFKEANPKITVERKVQDILLDKLPWNIGISRLPWLDYLLFTDW